MSTTDTAAAQAEIDNLGPIDYIVLEWAGAAARARLPLMLDLSSAGIIRILDVALIVKGDDGTVAALDLAGSRRRTAASPSSRAPRPACSAGGPRGGGQRARPGTVRRGARVGEPLGGAGRRRAAPLRRPARRQRPHPLQAVLAALERSKPHAGRRRNSMPGLLAVARTAVIAGTATAVSNRVSRRQANRWARQEPGARPRRRGRRLAPAAAPGPSRTRARLAGARRAAGPRACSRKRSSRRPRPSSFRSDPGPQVWSCGGAVAGSVSSDSSISAAFTRLLTSSASARPELQKIALMCFSTARLVRNERLGDRRVALALGDLGEHLALARRQLVERRALAPRAARVDERLDDLRVDHRAAVGDRADRRRQLGAVVHALLEQVGAAVGAVARAARARSAGRRTG